MARSPLWMSTILSLQPLTSTIRGFTATVISPAACYWNLEKLAVALKGVVDGAGMEAGLAQYQPKYAEVFCSSTLQKLGFPADLAATLPADLQRDLLLKTVHLLEETHVGYHDFFTVLTQQFVTAWQTEPERILTPAVEKSDPAAAELLKEWRSLYQTCLSQLPPEKMADVQACLRATNPMTVLLRSQIEAVWEPITTEDNWQPFYDLLEKIKNPMMA